MRNNKRKFSLLNSPPSSPPQPFDSPPRQHSINIKPRTIQLKQKQQQFFKLTEDILAKRGLGDENKICINRKSSIAIQMSQTISNVPLSQQDIQLKLAVPKKTGGRSGKLLDGTELIKEMVKEKSEDSVLSQQKKSNKKDNKLNKKQSRDELFKELKKNQMTKKSAHLTAEQIRETFKKTSLEELKVNKKRSQQNQQSKQSMGQSQSHPGQFERNNSLMYQKQSKKQRQDESLLLKELNDSSLLYDQEQSLRSSILDDSVSACDKKPKQKKKKEKKPKGKKRLKNKKKSQFIEYEAQQSGSDVGQSQQESDEEDDRDLEGLIDNDIKIDEKNEAAGRKKMLEQMQKEDQILMEKILRGELFKKRSIPKVLPSQKIKQNRRQQLKNKCSEGIGMLGKRNEEKSADRPVEGAPVKKDTLPLPRKQQIDGITEAIYEEEKETFQMNQYLQGYRAKDYTKPSTNEVPKILVKKFTVEKGKQRVEVQRKKRASLIDPKVKPNLQAPTALGTWINQQKCFLREEQTAVSETLQ